MNYSLLYKLEREAHQETFDKCNDEVIRLIREKQQLQKKLESLGNLMNSTKELNETLMKTVNILENQQQEECKDYKLVKVEYYA